MICYLLLQFSHPLESYSAIALCIHILCADMYSFFSDARLLCRAPEPMHQCSAGSVSPDHQKGMGSSHQPGLLSLLDQPLFVSRHCSRPGRPPPGQHTLNLPPLFSVAIPRPRGAAGCRLNVWVQSLMSLQQPLLLPNHDIKTTAVCHMITRAQSCLISLHRHIVGSKHTGSRQHPCDSRARHHAARRVVTRLRHCCCIHRGRHPGRSPFLGRADHHMHSCVRACHR